MKTSTLLRAIHVVGAIFAGALGAWTLLTLLGLVGQLLLGQSSVTPEQFVYVSVFRTSEPLWMMGLKAVPILGMFAAMAGAVYCMAQALWLALQLVWAVARTLPIPRRG